MTEQPRATPTVAVVVLNWNNASDTLDCLVSLRRHEPDAHVVVVDNASSDDSVERIRRSALGHDLVRAQTNLGFTGGNNVGLRRALDTGARYVAVLNNDTILPSAMLSALTRQLDDTSAVSPVIVRADDPTSVWFAGGIVARGMPRHLQPDELADDTADLVDTALLTGCCIVAHREVWRRVGLFDERFFLFFEDSDWSMRAAAAGVALRVDRTQTLHHGVSRSFRGDASMLGTFYYARNGVFFHRRYARGLTARFVLSRVLLPPLRGVLGRGPRLPAWPFGVVGAVFGVAGRGGPAPRWLTAWAGRAARRQERRRGSSDRAV